MGLRRLLARMIDAVGVPDGYVMTANSDLASWEPPVGGAVAASDVAVTPTGGISSTDVQAALAELDTEKATLASPVFTGDPKAPTPASSDNDTSIATTAFVQTVVAALLASPTFTGDPKAPTPSPGDNDTSIATTAFVQAAITALIGGAPGALDTLKELADAINDDASYAATVTAALALKAPSASPAFTGNPTAPTATVGDNDTSIATTAFVQTAVAAGVSGAALDDSQVSPVTPLTPAAGAYTFVLADKHRMVLSTNNTTAVTYTVPLNSVVAFPIGTALQVVQNAAGQVTIAGSVGVTLNNKNGLKTSGANAVLTILKIATDTWVVTGDTST